MRMRSVTPGLGAALLTVLVAACAGSGAATDGVGGEAANREASPALTGGADLRRPNIIWIVADDLGYGDVGAFGGRVETPNIDRLGAEGARFTDAHSMGAVCSPSRAGLMTGRYQARFGHDVNPVGVGGVAASLPKGEITIADRMRAAGYRTGLIGKWHLGGPDGYTPVDRGFDEFFGFNAAARFISEPEPGDLVVDLGDSEERAGAARRLIRGREPAEREGYLTDILSEETLGFIDRNADAPFFLVVTHYATHVPLQATAEYVNRVRGVEDPAQRAYAAMTIALDDAVGALIGKVQAEGLEDRTLVVFTSDNGCPAYLDGRCSNGRLSGHKRDLREGGHRVPLLARWPGVIPPGHTIDTPVLGVDLGATSLELAGLDVSTLPSIDGRGLLPLLKGETRKAPHDVMFWRAGGSYAVRSGDWKLIVAETPGGAEADFLFDLAVDPEETRNLAAREPSRVARMKAAFAAFNAGNIPPRFQPRKIEVEIAGERVLMSF